MTRINTYPDLAPVSSTGMAAPEMNWVGVAVRELWEGAVIVRTNCIANIENVVGVVDHVDWSGRSPVVVYTNGTRARVTRNATLAVGKVYGKNKGAAWLEASHLA